MYLKLCRLLVVVTVALQIQAQDFEIGKLHKIGCLDGILLSESASDALTSTQLNEFSKIFQHYNHRDDYTYIPILLESKFGQDAVLACKNTNEETFANLRSVIKKSIVTDLGRFLYEYQEFLSKNPSPDELGKYFNQVSNDCNIPVATLKDLVNADFFYIPYLYRASIEGDKTIKYESAVNNANKHFTALDSIFSGQAQLYGSALWFRVIRFENGVKFKFIESQDIKALGGFTIGYSGDLTVDLDLYSMVQKDYRDASLKLPGIIRQPGENSDVFNIRKVRASAYSRAAIQFSKLCETFIRDVPEFACLNYIDEFDNQTATFFLNNNYKLRLNSRILVNRVHIDEQGNPSLKPNGLLSVSKIKSIDNPDFKVVETRIMIPGDWDHNSVVSEYHTSPLGLLGYSKYLKGTISDSTYSNSFHYNAFGGGLTYDISNLTHIPGLYTAVTLDKGYPKPDSTSGVSDQTIIDAFTLSLIKRWQFPRFNLFTEFGYCTRDFYFDIEPNASLDNTSQGLFIGSGANYIVSKNWSFGITINSELSLSSSWTLNEKKLGSDIGLPDVTYPGFQIGGRLTCTLPDFFAKFISEFTGRGAEQIDKEKVKKEKKKK